MAKKHPNQEDHSGDEMHVSSPETASSASDSESEQPPKVTKAPVIRPPSSSSSSQSDLDVHKPKPISSKPMDPTSSKKSRSKPSVKRPADEDQLKVSKKSKKKPEQKIEKSVQKTPTPTEDMKRQLFQRLWSEDDEISILKGMIDYRLKKKADPVADINAFHQFIKKSLQVDGTKAQLLDKIRRLKKKYLNNVAKEKMGKERTFSKPHEEKSYDLSKKIWGKEKIDNVVEVNETPRKVGSKSGVVKDNGVLVDRVKEEENKIVVKVVENAVEGSESVSFASLEASVGVVEKWLEENVGSISVEKRNEMNEKLRSLKFTEMELRSKRINLIEEQLSLVKEAMKAHVL